MQITNQKRNVETIGVAGARRFEIAQTSHMMQVLTSQYSNIPGSIVREYASNMIDGYTKLDKSKPFIKPRLHLPSTIEPFIEFMDFGCGMSFETVWEVFPKMGASTKQSNNDEIGGFGLGAKTAFAYKSAEQWTVESRFEGKKMIFNAHWGEDGWPAFVHVVTVETAEANGVTVRIPVNPKDFSIFHQEAAKFLEFFPLEIEVTGVDTTWMIRKSEYLLEGKDWKISQGYNVNRVVVGPVAYDIKLDSLFGRTFNNYYAHSNSFTDNLLMKNSVTLFVPIGSVDIVPNREALMFTDRTKTTILGMFDKILKDAEDLAAKEVAGAKSEWEALKKMANIWNIPAIQRSIKTVTWNGKTLNPQLGLTVDKVALVNLDSEVQVFKIANSGNSALHDYEVNLAKPDPTKGFLGANQPIILNPMEEVFIYLDDLKRGGNKRVKTMLRDKMDADHGSNAKTYTGKRRKYWTNKTYSAFVIKSEDIVQKEITSIWGGVPVLLTSSLPQPPRVKRAKRKVELKQWVKNTNNYNYNYWDEVQADTSKKAYYVRMNRNNFVDIPSAGNVISSVHKAKLIDEKIPVYCIPKTLDYLEKTPKWENLKDVLERIMTAKITKIDSSIYLRNAWETYTKKYECPNGIKQLFSFKSSDFDKDTLPYEILSDARRDFDIETQTILQLADASAIKLGDHPLPYKIEDKAKELLNKCPMLNYVNFGYLTSSDKKVILNYITEQFRD